MGTIFGTVTATWPAFGVDNAEIGTIFMNTKATSYESEDAVVQDEIGDTVLKAKYDKKDKFTFEGVIKLPAHLQDLLNGGVDIRDAFISINDAHGNVRKMIMDSASIAEDNTSFVKLSGEGTFYPKVAEVVTPITL